MDRITIASPLAVLQIVLLVCFALCALSSFLCRLRAGMLIGAADRGAKAPDEVENGVRQWRSRAAKLAAVAGGFLVLCLLAGALTRLGG